GAQRPGQGSRLWRREPRAEEREQCAWAGGHTALASPGRTAMTGGRGAGRGRSCGTRVVRIGPKTSNRQRGGGRRLAWSRMTSPGPPPARPTQKLVGLAPQERRNLQVRVAKRGLSLSTRDGNVAPPRRRAGRRDGGTRTG